MTSDQPLVLRVGAPRELLEALPHLVGFVPYDSLVLMLVRSSAGSKAERVELTVRIDLPPLAAASLPSSEPVLCDTTEFRDVVERAVSASGADGVVVVAWGAPSALGQPVMDVPALESWLAADLKACAGVVASAGLRLRDVLVVAGDRYRSTLCSDLTCCPIDGMVFSPAMSSSASAQAVASGRPMPAANREALVADIAQDHLRTAATVVALGIAGCVATHQLVQPQAVPGLARPRSQVRSVAGAMSTWAHSGELSPQVVADTAVACARGTVREHAVRWMLEGVEGIDQRQFWLYLTRALPAPFNAATAALAAIGALLEGDGAAANIALDRARQALDQAQDPLEENTFAALVDNVGFLVGAGSSPDIARAVLSSAYGWFTPVTVPQLGTAAATRHASGE